MTALEIFCDAQDEHNLSIVVRSLARLYQANPDKDLAVRVAAQLGLSLDELLTRFADEVD